MGRMQKLYEEYRGVAEFRIVYINEAHAADGDWPVKYAEEKGITEATNYGERCTTAEMMLVEERVTIPCIIDNMDNHVNQSYSAWPDRLFLVEPNGRLAVAGKRGPWGFKPAIAEAEEWLAAYEAGSVKGGKDAASSGAGRLENRRRREDGP